MGQMAAALTAFPILRDDRNDAVDQVIDEICGMEWQQLSGGEVLQAAMAYWYFSIQFRENLVIACRHYPEDGCLQRLYAEECNTDNLSPWPGVAATGEKLDHDEFMRRLLSLQPIEHAEPIARAGGRYLEQVRGVADIARAKSIASYEDGGLTSVFLAMLRAPQWGDTGLAAFRFFLEQHIKFDSDDGGGHGSLSRHLIVDLSVVPLWTAFAELLAAAVPTLTRPPVESAQLLSLPTV
jgi:hypothetical protein